MDGDEIMWGLGSTNIGPLAQAQFAGLLANLSYLPNQPFNVGGFESTLCCYMSTGSAEQIASLLGGMVVQQPLPGYPGSLPGNLIQLPDGSVFNPATVFQPNTFNYDMDSECAVEQSLVMGIPGTNLSPTCAGGATGETTAQLAVASGGGPASEGNNIVGYTPYAAPPPAPVPAAPAVVPAKTNVGQPTPVNPPAASQVVSATPGANVGPSSPPQPPPIFPPSCFNPISSWIGADTCLGPMGLIEWAIAAGVLLLVLKGGR